jgi:hypothetical protein
MILLATLQVAQPQKGQEAQRQQVLRMKRWMSRHHFLILQAILRQLHQGLQRLQDRLRQHLSCQRHQQQRYRARQGHQQRHLKGQPRQRQRQPQGQSKLFERIDPHELRRSCKHPFRRVWIPFTFD